MIAVQGLSYAVGKKRILENLSFELQKGEMLAVLGANGAGKSTLLKLLCKELRPSAGSIRIDNTPIQQLSIKQLAKIRAVLMQQNTLTLPFSVGELVMMGRYPHFQATPRSLDHDIVAAVLQETGITHLAQRSFHTLSGGEQQRVHLARVMAQIYDQQHAYLFLDEPTNGLDLLYQQQILQLAKNMALRGFTVLCILHDINIASRFADKILLLKKGEKIAFGQPKEIITHQSIQETYDVSVKLIETKELDWPIVVATDS